MAEKLDPIPYSYAYNDDNTEGITLAEDDIDPADDSDPRNDSGITRHTISLRKFSKRRVAESTLVAFIEILRNKVMTPNRVRQGWSVEISPIATEVVDSGKELTWKYRAPAGDKVYGTEWTFTHKQVVGSAQKQSAQEIALRFKNIVNTLVASSNQRSTGSWMVQAVDGKEWEDVEADVIKQRGDTDFVQYAPFEVPANWQTKTAHIYDRDAQIRLVMSCIFAAVNDDFQTRFNALFVGDPANGKTEVGLALASMFGPGAFLRVDGTAMTQAGLTKDLTERDELPRIIFVEEIEKGDEQALKLLLGIMDTRGEIRKITARDNIQRDAKCIVIATCNDFDKLAHGMGSTGEALCSRFGEPIYFPSVDRRLMQKILDREVKRIGGDERWITPVLDYCDRRSIRDPRKAISFCLRGREGWLDGSFEADLEAVRKIGVKRVEA